MVAMPAQQPNNGKPAYNFNRLSEFGVLWLINRSVFHPRGFALSLVYAEGNPEPVGWALEGDGSEPWHFDESVGEDEKFAQILALLAQASEFGRAPHTHKDD